MGPGPGSVFALDGPDVDLAADGTVDVVLPVDPGDAVPGPPPDPRIVRRRRRVMATAIATGVVTTSLVIAGLVRLPYYTIAPGSVRSTEGLVAIDGADAYRDTGGDVSFTTVSIAEATALTLALGWLDPTVEVLPRQTALGGQEPEENRKRNLEMMNTSKQTAQVVALRKLGYDVKATGTGAVVAFVKDDAPVDDVLDVDDVVIGVDGHEVKIREDLIGAISAKRPGDAIELKVERSLTGAVEDVRTTVVASESDPSRPMLGVQVGTRQIEFQLPFTVSIDSGDVGGPSAGLAFTLGVIDVLTPGSLTGGKRVATTGTIDLAGNVGPVGGVPQKTVGVRRSGAELFLVPPDEYQEALRFAGDMKVVSVETLDDALEAIADLGQDPSAVALAADPTKPDS